MWLFLTLIFDSNKPRCYSVQMENFSIFSFIDICFDSFERFFLIVLRYFFERIFERFFEVFSLSNLGSVWFDSDVYLVSTFYWSLEVVKKFSVMVCVMVVLKATLVFIIGPNLKTNTLLRPRPYLNNCEALYLSLKYNHNNNSQSKCSYWLDTVTL